MRWLLLFIALPLALSGCTAMHTSISKGKLDVQMRMSQTIYLDPVDPAFRTVFLDIRQTASEYQQPLMRDVAELLTARGYQLVNSPQLAQYWLQVNIRAVLNQPPQQVLREQDNMDEQQIAELMHPGMAPQPPRQVVSQRGSAPAVVYTDSSIGSDVSGRDIMKVLAVVAVIAGAEYVGNQIVKDKYYTLLADLQVAERISPASENLVQEISEHILMQGDSGQLEQLWQNTTEMRKYQVRLVGFANKANLTWQEAEQPLHLGLLRSLAGIF